MLYRSLPDLPAPTEADLDTAAMAASEASLERADYHLRILGELTEIGLNLVRSLGALAQARIEAALLENRALTPAEDAGVASLNKVAQTVRRTVALRERIDAGAKAGREGLIAERARRRADLDTDHATDKTEAILDGLHDAYAVDTPQAEYEENIERLMEDTREHLRDADEFRGWLDRPVGETVAKLCAQLGLDPDGCVLDGETWTVRRPPTEFERTFAKFLPPSAHGEGGFERIEKTGREWRRWNDPP